APSGAENTNTAHNNTTTKPADTPYKRDCSTRGAGCPANKMFRFQGTGTVRGGYSPAAL
ncbi:UNVERIFIED_ORG: hypothetical protein ABIB52_004026, partial [Arthrobacter sp. UYCu721]